MAAIKLAFVRVASLMLVLVCAGCSSFGKGSKEKDYSVELESAEKIYQAGNLDEAKKAYQKILDESAAVPQANYRLGTIAFKQKHYEEAEKYFSTTTQIAPRFDKAHYNLAVTHLILAEDHLKYYVATSSENADIETVSKILSAIDNFAQGSGESKPQSKPKKQSSLEKISSELKGQGLGVD